MPPTGNQASVLRNVPSDAPEDVAWPIQQIVSLLNGYFGAPVWLTGWNSAAQPSLFIRNNDATYSWAIKCVNAGGGTFFDLWKDGLTITPPIDAVNADFSGTVTIAQLLTVLGTVGGSARLLSLTDALVKLATGVSADVRIGETTGNVSIGSVNGDATDVFIGGTSSYVSITCANMDITTGGYFHVNGVDVSAPTYQTTYTGNGVTTGRQITCGFVPKHAILTGGTVDADLQHYQIHGSSSAVKMYNGGNAMFTSSVKLHASDGITVGSGSTEGNVNTKPYTLVAFR